MSPATNMREDLQALLRWYVDMGVDIGVDERPHDRFAESLPTARAGAPASPGVLDPRSPAPGPAASVVEHGVSRLASQADRESLARPGFVAGLSADEAVRSARESAAAARTLSDLCASLSAFEGCGLKGTATNLVFADGNPEGRVMAVGEAPGADEDRQGRPFVGRSGQLFDRMLRAVGLDRTQVYIANTVPWRPPGNRTPTPQEVAVCLPFIERQIELADPDILICLGGAAAQSLLGTKEGILRLRGRWFDYQTGSRGVKAMAMLHPAYLLRQPAHKKLAWRDLLELRKALDEIEPRGLG